MSFAKVIGISLSPRQLGSPDTRPQERLGFFKLPNRSMEKILKVMRIFRNTISHSAFHIRPYELIGIKFGSISGKRVCMNPAAVLDESFNRLRFMNGASIPQEHKAILKMPQDNLKKADNLRIADILRNMETNVKPDTRPAGRNANRRDCGNLCPSSGDFENRGFPQRGPSLPDSGDKQKPALVEKNNWDIKFFGLFLYAATDNAPIALSPSHPVPALSSRVSGSSSRVLLIASRHEQGDKRHRIAYQSPLRFCAMSKDPLNNRSSSPLLQESGLKNVSGACSVSRAAPEQVLLSRLRHLSSFEDRSSNTPNLTNNQVSQLFPADSILYPRAPRLAGGAFQALFGFHVVSWNQYTIFLLLMQMSIMCEKLMKMPISWITVLSLSILQARRIYMFICLGWKKSKMVQ